MVNAINGLDNVNWSIKEYIDKPKNRQLTNDTKFSQYQLNGEKENYKEIMTVLPREGSMKKVGDYTVPSAHKYGKI